MEQIRRPHESNDVRSVLLANFSLALLCECPKRRLRSWHTPRTLTRYGFNTHQKYWNQVALWILTSLEQLSNYELHCTQDTMDLLAGMLFDQKAEGKPLASRYFMSDLEKTMGLWHNWSFRRRIVEDARGRSSRPLRFCFVCRKRNDRCKSQKSNSPTDGMIVSSNTGNLPGQMMEKRFISYSAYFLAKRRTRSCVRLMNGFDKVMEKMNNTSLQKPVLIEFSPWRWWTKFRFLQRNRKQVKRHFCKTRKENGAYFGKFKPGYFMYIDPGLEKTSNFEKYPYDQQGKWNELEKSWYGCVCCADASNPESMYQFPERRIEARWRKRSLRRQWSICKNHDGSHQLSQRLRYGFRNLWSSWKDYLDRPMKVDEIRLQLFSFQESRRTSVCLELLQLTISQVTPSQRRGNLLARASPFEHTWQAGSERSMVEGNFPLVPNQQTRKAVVEKANEKTDKELVRLCKILDYAEIRKIGRILSNKACKKQRWIAQHTLWRSWQTNHCWTWTITSNNFSRKQYCADQRFQQWRKLWQRCDSAKREQPWDVDLGECVHRRSSNIVVRLQQSVRSFWQKIKSSETSEGSGQLAAQDVPLIAKGSLEHEQPPVQERSWSIVPCPRYLPGKTQSGVSKKWHVGNRDSTGILSWRECLKCIQKGQPEHDQRTDTVSDSWKAHQSKKERCEVCWKEVLMMTGQPSCQKIHTSVCPKERLFIRAIQLS